MRWSGKAAAGLPAQLISARTCPAPGSRISSGSAAVGMPAALPRSPRTRIGAPAWAGRGGFTCARGTSGGSRVRGLRTRSPSRSHLPVRVVSSKTRYSHSVLDDDMLGPVPAKAQPRRPDQVTSGEHQVVGRDIRRGGDDSGVERRDGGTEGVEPLGVLGYELPRRGGPR